ncbi:MAG: D-lyxose/D-mannose family sugar isomerase [Planctomycetota bacterium]|jgi:D-lyxose ketol-isomerase
MLDAKKREAAVRKTLEYLDKVGIVLTEQEKQNIEIADFGLDEPERTGLQIITYVNTGRCCAKELILFPHQTCPEHRHPAVGAEPGKEETFRCRFGEVYLYVPGAKTVNPKADVPKNKVDTYTVWNEVILRPGEQYTLTPNTLHWFQAGPAGAVVSEFSTQSRDENDIFTDPEIHRMP